MDATFTFDTAPLKMDKDSIREVLIYALRGAIKDSPLNPSFRMVLDQLLAETKGWEKGPVDGVKQKVCGQSAENLIYVYKCGESYGYGIRVGGDGLVTVTEPVVKTEDQAKDNVEAVYNDLKVYDIAALQAKLPWALRGARGTPTFGWCLNED